MRYTIYFLILVGLGALLWWKAPQFTRPAPPVKSIPAVSEASATPFHFALSPIYLQNDPRWGDDTIGGSHESLAAVGCTVTSVSMALAHYGITLPPKQLNNLLKQHNGYTRQGWLIWHTIAVITDNKIRVEVPAAPSHALIDAALSARRPVIAKVLLHNVIPHWVLVVGKAEQDYLIKDPLGNGKTLDKLSKFGSAVYAIRIVKQI